MMGRSVQDYIKMDYEGKSIHAKQEMNRLVYRDFLFRVATGKWALNLAILKILSNLA